VAEEEKTLTPLPEETTSLPPAPVLEIQSFEHDHMKRLKAICQMCEAPVQTTLGCRPAGPRPRQQLQQAIRQQAVHLHQCLAEQGRTCAHAATRLGIPVRTLRKWHQTFQRDQQHLPTLGRPIQLSSPEQCAEVFRWLIIRGPGLGLPTLRNHCPDPTRAELEQIVTFYRRWWQEQNQVWRHQLHWRRPGTVWAMDFTEPPAPVDGRYGYLLAVRDLASGYQLLWWPVLDMTAAVTIEALTLLFTIHGTPPLVLKSDNGSAFIAGETLQLLQTWQVQVLFSPPQTPSYNGAIEAGNGSLKARTQDQADAANRSGQWTSADLEAARFQANASHPRRLKGRSPEEAWTSRSPLTAIDRQRFQATVDQERCQTRAQKGILPSIALKRHQQAAVDRVALPRALVAHDYLSFTRRRIPSPIPRQKAAIYT
jgi:transposase InsO family protein